MKILVIGSGGREHAICWAFAKSASSPEIFCAPGNAGIAAVATCINVLQTNINELADFAAQNAIDFTFVGGETPLALGIVDEFERRRLKIIGASQKAAMLESSKIFAKDFMTRHDIPTARYETANNADEAFAVLRSSKFGDENSPVVVKADGLAAGKGVVVAKNRAEAENAIREMMLENSIGADAAKRVLLEETLVGREVSLLLFADGKDFALMPAARDHKRIGENDTGANTGGMGTISDSSLLNETQLREIISKIIEPTLRGAARENFPFKGVLFLGLMMTNDGAKVIEYNVRFGDPETQVLLVRLKTDFVTVCEAIINQNLANTNVEFSDDSSACVVLAAANYPYKPRTGDAICGLENAAKHENAIVFHAGTTLDENGNFVTNGGRVLGVTATGENLTAALLSSYAAVDEISWDGMQFRRDIGR